MIAFAKGDGGENVREERSRGSVREGRRGRERSRGTFARERSRRATGERTFARERSRGSVREGTFAKGDLQGHRSCQYSFLCRLQLVSRHVIEVQEIGFKKFGTELRRGRIFFLDEVRDLSRQTTEN